MNRTVVAQTPFGEALLFKRLIGTESVSALFQLDLQLLSQNPNLDGKAIVGKTITLDIETESGETRHLNGLVTEFGYTAEDEDEEGYYLYACTARPFLWYLTQKIDSRVFVNKSVIDIANEVLAPFGFPFQIKCQKSYRTRGYCVQYQENCLSFLNRLLEQEGIFYYFEHNSGSHELIITDSNQTLPKIKGKSALPYHSRKTAAGAPSTSYLDSWIEKDALRSSQFVTQEYNYQNAKVQMQSSNAVHDFDSVPMEHYDFYTGFNDVSEAPNYSQVRSEDLAGQTKQINASGTALTVAPGYRFTLERHPHRTSNTEYIILQAQYELEESGYTTGEQIGAYRISFQAFLYSKPYRPMMLTPKPRVLGAHAATITGPAGEEVHTNEYGDVKIQFHWDRHGQFDENSSNWVRVIQGSAGGGFGSINTPRIGEEVLVDFINGDADRPVVVGRLYNSAMIPPWGFPASAKKSGIKSKSFNSPLANFNEFSFDDTAGSELVNFQAQKDLTSLVKNDETREVNHDRTTTIGNDETVTVVGNRTETVQKNETIAIVQNRDETVGQNETIGITQNQSITVGENQSVDVVQNRTRTVGQNESVSVGASQAITVTNDQNVTIGVNQALSVGANRNKTIVANEVNQIGGNRQQTVNLNGINNVGIAQMTNIGAGFMLNIGGGWLTNVGAAEMHNVGGIMGLNAGVNIGLNANRNITLTAGNSITLQVGDSAIVITNKQISIVSKKVVIVGTSKVDINGKKVDIN